VSTLKKRNDACPPKNCKKKHAVILKLKKTFFVKNVKNNYSAAKKTLSDQ
jgi:hypothetical protein